MYKQRLIVDSMTGTILDASAGNITLVEFESDDLDFVEDIVNNWGSDAALSTVRDLGGSITTL